MKFSVELCIIEMIHYFCLIIVGDIITIAEPLSAGLMTMFVLLRRDDNALLSELERLSQEQCGGPWSNACVTNLSSFKVLFNKTIRVLSTI